MNFQFYLPDNNTLYREYQMVRPRRTAPYSHKVCFWVIAPHFKFGYWKNNSPHLTLVRGGNKSLIGAPHYLRGGHYLGLH